MDLLEDSKMSLLSFNFVMIYIIHKITLLLKIQSNYLKDIIFECFCKDYDILLFYFFKIIFFTIYNDGKFLKKKSLEEENIIENIRNLLD